MDRTQVNGFEIEEFNRFGLKEFEKEGTCPLCSSHRKPENQKKKCASYDWERGIGTCHHCGEAFQMHTYKKRNSEVKKNYKKPEKTPETSLSEKLLKLFKDRGISESTLEYFKIGEGKEWMPNFKKEVNTMQFPFFLQGDLVNVKFRDPKKGFKFTKDAERILYNIDSIQNMPEAVIVEGEFDALSMHEAGVKNVVSVPNGATLGHNNIDYINEYLESHFDDKDRIILAVDQDEAGEALRSEFVRRLGAEKCYIVDFGKYKDANEVLVAEGAEVLKSMVEEAKPVPLENVETIKDHMESLRDLVENGFSKGFQIGLPNFDEIFSTYTKQFITVTGIPSSGKSDFVDQMCVGYNEKYDWKIGYASPENQPFHLHTHKLVRKILGTMPSKKDLDTEQWNSVIDHINDNYFFINMERFDLDSVLAKGAELVKRKGIKCLVIDPFNKVRDRSNDASGDVNKYTMDYLMKIDDFCKKWDVLAIVVAHPNKMYPDRSGGSNKLPIPTMYDIKGGGEWYDASYHGLVVHRDYEANTTIVKVNKVKFQNLGENGAECYFTWDKKSGRFIPHYQVDENDTPPEHSGNLTQVKMTDDDDF